MKVTEQEVRSVAELSQLELSAEEQSRMVRDLNSILGYMNRLNQLDTTNVEPKAQVSDHYGKDSSRQGSARFAHTYREDIAGGLRPSLTSKVALQNAPMNDGTFFRVPKVIDKV